MLNEEPGLATGPAAAETALPDRLRQAPRSLYETLFAGAARRFLTVPMAIALGAYGLLWLTFGKFVVEDDGRVYYDYMRAFLGEHVPGTRAYQIGSAYFDIPFYLVARLVEVVSGPHRVFGASLGEASIAVASLVAVVLTLYLGWRILAELELPAGPGVLMLALFGTPLLYYAVFEPSYKHSVDALATTFAAFLLLRALDDPSRRVLMSLGVVLAYLLTVRYANVALIPGLVLPLALAREWSRLRVVALSFLVALVVLVALPVVRGIPYHAAGPAFRLGTPAAQPVQATQPQVLEAGLVASAWGLCPDQPVHLTTAQCLHNKFGIWVKTKAPLWMLFSTRRGLFLWTPLTAVSVLGIALLIARRPERRRYLVGLSVSAFLLLLIHMLWGDFWWDGFSFSQRFLSALFPFFLIGTAEIVRRFRGFGIGVLTLCALWSTFVAFNLYVGWRGITDNDGVGTIVHLYTSGQRTPQGLAHTVVVHALDRYRLHTEPSAAKRPPGT
jgi:hypothetical protein